MVNRNMPGTNHHQRFVEVQYAKNIKTNIDNSHECINLFNANAWLLYNRRKLVWGIVSNERRAFSYIATYDVHNIYKRWFYGCSEIRHDYGNHRYMHNPV